MKVPVSDGIGGAQSLMIHSGLVSTVMADATSEIQAGERFGFGDNWADFLNGLTEARIREAEESLQKMLGIEDLKGIRMVDIGSGSGLFSLAAHQLGAEVVSFDFDPASVGCAAELRRRYYPDDPTWTVMQGSALDKAFLEGLGQFDIVYSWGVLHHTGDMRTALGNVVEMVKPQGRLFISIYNDQGPASRMWTRVKRRYNAAGAAERRVIIGVFDVYFRARALGPLRKLYRRIKHIPEPTTTRGRGMDRKHDLVDWVGGYPFEVAKPEEIFDFYRDRGFTLERLKTCAGGLGCNEFVLRRN